MAKRKRHCWECASVDASLKFDFDFAMMKGNGRCSTCKGTGYERDDGEAIITLANLVAGFGLVDNSRPCPDCASTGQCQFCGGTGYIYHDEDTEIEGSDTEEDGREEDDTGEYDTEEYDTEEDDTEVDCLLDDEIFTFPSYELEIKVEDETHRERNINNKYFATEKNPEEYCIDFINWFTKDEVTDMFFNQVNDGFFRRPISGSIKCVKLLFDLNKWMPEMVYLMLICKFRSILTPLFRWKLTPVFR